MSFHLPAVRKGLIPMGISDSPYGGGFSDYGARVAGVGWPTWVWKRSRYQKCAGYRKQVDLWVKKKKSYKERYGTVGWFKKGSQDAANHLRAIEKRGKAEWKKCSSSRRAQKKGWTQIDTSMPGSGAGLIDPMTGMPLDPMAGGEFISSEEDTGGLGSGVWYALGGLLLIGGGVVAYKKFKKKKK